MALAAGSALILLLIWWNPAHEPLPAKPVFDPHQLTDGPGFDGFLSFSPDSSRVAFSSDRAGSLDLYVRDLAGGSPALRLTSGGQNVQPVWSFDGQFIAYHDIAGGGIWIVSSRGGSARRISAFGSHPAWSPDGTRIAFQSASADGINGLALSGEPSAIYVANADGRTAATAVTSVGEPAISHLAPRWWGARTLILAVARRHGADVVHSLWSLDLESGERRSLASYESLTHDYTLSADGRGIFYRTTANAIWWMPVDHAGIAGRPQPTGVPAIGSRIAHIAVSADGRRMAWTALESIDQLWAAYRRSGQNIVAPVTGQASSGQAAVRASIPGSDQVLVAAKRRGVVNVESVSPSTSTVELLTPFQSPRISVRHPRWDPDDERILFDRSETKGRTWSVELR